MNTHDRQEELDDQFDTMLRNGLDRLAAQTPTATPNDFDDTAVVRFAQRDHADRRVRPVAFVGLAAATVLVVGWAMVQRDRTADVAPAGGTTASSTSLPSTTASTGTVATTWMVRLAPGVVAWYEANDPITAQLGNPRPGPAQDRIRCTEWETTADIQTVACSAVAGEGYLPAVSYGDPSPDGAYVDISTLPGTDTDATTYATNWSQGKDVGYESPPLVQTDVTINGIAGRLIAAPNGSHRLTWAITPGTLVAVETGPTLTVDQLMTVARDVAPATPPPSIPLLLASATDTTGRTVEAVGDVADGDVCLTTFDRGCVSLEDGTGGSVFVLQNNDGYLVGLATPGIASIRVTQVDGTVTDFATIAQPTSTSTRAFAVIVSNATAVQGLDANDAPIAGANEDVAVNPVVGSVAPTTSLAP